MLYAVCIYIAKNTLEYITGQRICLFKMAHLGGRLLLDLLKNRRINLFTI